ncbi:MAG: glycosyltransferase family 2 protein, partial [Desulfocucumaceae bacterium]
CAERLGGSTPPSRTKLNRPQRRLPVRRQDKSMFAESPAQKTGSPKVNAPYSSVIVVTCNSERFIGACLDSILKQSSPGIEIIVVDNLSKDTTIRIIKKDFPGIVLIENNANLGAAEARNRGIVAARGDWVFFLDCDTRLGDDFFPAIIRVIEELHPEVGMLQPKILKPDKTIYSCGIRLTWARRFYDIGSRGYDKGQFGTKTHVFGPCAAAAVYRRKALEDLKENTGYFDRRFFFLAEDLDLAWRARRQGWECLFVPEALCYHAGNSSGIGRKYRQYLSWRNRYLAIRKNEGILRYARKILSVLLYDLPRLFYLGLTNRFVRSSIFKAPGATNPFPERQEEL